MKRKDVKNMTETEIIKLFVDYVNSNDSEVLCKSFIGDDFL